MSVVFAPAPTPYHVSQRCKSCQDGREQLCPLNCQGAVLPPIKRTRRASQEDPGVELEEVFTRMLAFLAYGAIGLLRVNACKCAGQNVVPVVFARKAPIPWDRLFLTDGLFQSGNIMVWTCDVIQLSERRCRSFEVFPEAGSRGNQRGVPLEIGTTLGMPMRMYLT